MFSLCLSLIVIIADLQRAMGASGTPWSGAVKQENLEKLSESDKERYFQFHVEKNSANSSAMLIYYCITNHFSRLKDLPLRPFE